MNAIYKFVLGLIGKRSGVITTLPNKKQIEFQANMLAEKFMQNGIDPNALKSPEQVKNVLANIDQSNMRVIPADSAEGKGITEQLLGKKKADVMDMEGNKISDGAKIMGGKEVKPIDKLQNYTKSKEEIVQDLVDRKFGEGYFDTVDESDAAIKARLDANNKKGIKTIKINLVDDSIARIKSLEPMDAMKEANLVAGKKGRYANLDDNQVKKIMDDTQDHIFERDIPDEDFATGGRVGLSKGGGLLKLLNFFNKKSPLQAGKDYLKNVKNKTLNANETGKFMDLPLAEVGIPAATGALVNNQIRKKLKAMNEEQKEENLKNFIIELEKDEFYQKYPDLKDETIASYTEKLFGEKKADGGRIGRGGGGSMGKTDRGYQGGGRNKKGSVSGTAPGAAAVGGGPEDKSNFTQNVNHKEAMRNYQKPPESKIKKAIEVGSEASFLNNLYKMDPIGLGLNIGGKMLYNKFIGNQSSLIPTEDDDTGIMKMADATTTPTADTMGLNLMDRKTLKDAGYSNNQIQELQNNPDINTQDVIRDIKGPIFAAASGGRAGLKGGGADFEMSNSDKEFEAYKNYLMNEGMIQGDRQLRDEMEKHKKKLREKRYGIAVADGGRIGLKAGSVDKMRRLILKAMGAGTVGVGAAKSGIFSFGKGAGKTVAKEVAQQTTSSMPPPYFFKLAEKIKMLGNDATATTDRTIAKTLDAKDGKSTYLLEEDVTSGDTIIKKINKENDEMITNVEIMELKKGEVVKGKDGKAMKTPDEYEEVTESNSRIYKDEFNDPDYEDGINVDEIIKEVDDKTPSIKYASGGLAYMLGE
jgi:hypothetical protein